MSAMQPMKCLDNNKKHEIKTSYKVFYLLNCSPPPAKRSAPAISNKKEFPPSQTILEIDCSKSSFPTSAFNSKRKQLSIFRQEQPHELH